MSGWIKYFTDGTTEQGLDVDVLAGQASWSQGRLEGLSSVSLSHADRHISLSKLPGAGEFWQADTMESSPFTGTKVCARRLMYHTEPDDLYLQTYKTEHSTMLRVLKNPIVPSGDFFQIIPKSERGNWLILEYDPLEDKVKWWFSRSRDGEVHR